MRAAPFRRSALVALLAVAVVGPAAPPRAVGQESERTDALGDPLPPGALRRMGSIRLRHSESLQSAAFSPDGKYLASGGWGGSIILWEPTTGKELRQLTGLERGVYAVAFSPDGKLLAGAGVDQVVCLWDVATGKVLRRLTGHKGEVRAVAFSLKGDLLVSGDSVAARLWEVGSGKALHTFEVKEGGVSAVTFAPDGRTVVGAGGDTTARVWNTDSGTLLHHLRGHRGCINAVAFSPDGNILIAAGDNDTLFWDAASGQKVDPLPAANGHNSAVRFSPDGKLLATAGRDRAIHLWDWAARKELRAFVAHPDWVRALTFSRDGKTLASAGDGKIHLWDVSSGKPALDLPGHRERLCSVAYSSDGRTIATAAWDGTVRLWDPKTGAERRRLEVVRAEERIDSFRTPAAVSRVVLSPDGKLVAAARGDEVVLVWDAATGKEVSRYNAGSVAFSPDGKYIACGGRGTAGPDTNMGVIRLYDLTTGKEVREFRGHLTTIAGLTFAPDGKTLISTGQVLLGFRSGDPGEAETKFVRVWDVAMGKERGALPSDRESNSVTLSPDGRMTATRSRLGKTILLVEFASGGRRLELVGHTEMVFDVAFSPDGRTLASAGMDGTVRLWDVLAGKEIGRLEGHRGWVLSLAFAPDGATLVSGGIDSTALVWDVSRFVTRPVPAEELSPKDLLQLWDDLPGEAGRAYRAVARLTAAPDQAVPFLRERLRPVAAPEAARLARLIAALDSDDFEARDRAEAELEKLGTAADAAIRRTLAGKPSAEVRRRLQSVLEKWETTPLTAEEWRGLRAVEALEYLGTPGARRLVDEIAKGLAESPVTQAAEAARKRLLARTPSR